MRRASFKKYVRPKLRPSLSPIYLALSTSERKRSPGCRSTKTPLK